MIFHLLDIEGTVCPISFVHEKLFPYSKSRLKDFLEDRRNKLDLETVLKEASLSVDAPNSLSSAVSYLEDLIQRDVKSTLLKDIQGKIWDHGFRNGELKSPIYPDVQDFLLRVRDKGHRVGIYSSGSVLAQKNFFQYSELGSMSEWISGYFDTAMGPKRESSSYQKIMQTIGIQPSELHFYTDVVEEGEACMQAGGKAYLLLRPGNAPTKDCPFPKYTDFSQF